MRPEAFLKVAGNAYIPLSWDGKALEKIDVFHDCTLAYSVEAAAAKAGRS